MATTTKKRVRFTKNQRRRRDRLLRAASKMPTWTIERAGPVCTNLVFKMDSRMDEAWVLLTSDRHWDHPDSDHALQRKHLTQALERNAPVLDFGDLFCVMQASLDKRRSRGGSRPEHEAPNYFDLVVRDASRFFAPFAGQVALLGQGNHETAVVKFANTNLTDRLAYALGVEHKSPALAMGYRGWVRMAIDVAGARFSKTLYWHHGSGGNAEVTKGVIKAARRAAYLGDADVVVSGHIHEHWTMATQRLRVNAAGREYRDEQLHISLPSYKDSTTDRDGGWEIEKEFSPKPTGAVWLRLKMLPNRAGLSVSAIRADP